MVCDLFWGVFQLLLWLLGLRSVVGREHHEWEVGLC